MIIDRSVNRYYLKYAFYLLLGIAALVAVDYAQLEIPEIIGNLINALKTMTLTKENVKEDCLTILSIVGVMFVGRFTWRICIFGTGIKIEADLRSRLFAKAELLSQTYYQQNKVGSIMALYTNDVRTIRLAFARGTVMFVDALCLGVISFVKMIRIQRNLTLISAVPLAILAVASVYVGKYMEKKFLKRQEAYAKLSDFAQENFSGISVVKAFLKETHELLRFKKVNKENLDKNMDFIKTDMILETLIFGFFIGCVSVILYGVGSYCIYKGNTGFDVGKLTEFTAYFNALLWPMMAIAGLINLHSQAKASLTRINQVLNYPVDIKDAQDCIKGHEIKGEITFKNLNFSYPDTKRSVLNNISLTIPQGKSVGLIGKTGCGKTTLMDLLLRLYNIEEEQIFLDGVDIMKLPLKDVRCAISYAPQDNFLFSDTIGNNIAFSEKNKDYDAIRFAAQLSDVDSDILSFNNQYQTVLGERGVTISGGQKQRISIARALIKDAPILILDDSVSSVDTKTEDVIIGNLKAARKGKTTILIAHRITTVKKLDMIVVMDEGRIIGCGRHEELEKECPEYAKMVLLQRLEDDLGDSYHE